MKRLSSFLPLLVLLSGCATAVTSPSAPPAVSIAVDGVEAEQIDRFITEEMARRHIAGLSAAVISGGQIRYAKGYGLANVGRRTPVGADTPFLIASVTKMFTAVGTMLLVQDGKVQLDAAAGHLCPRPPASLASGDGSSSSQTLPFGCNQ